MVMCTEGTEVICDCRTVVGIGGYYFTIWSARQVWLMPLQPISLCAVPVRGHVAVALRAVAFNN